LTTRTLAAGVVGLIVAVAVALGFLVRGPETGPDQGPDPGTQSGPQPSPALDRAPTSAPAEQTVGTDYVALGDSFGSGPLIPLSRSDASGCFRSTNNYPAYLADLLDVVTYRDATCAGATIRDLRQSQRVFLGDVLPAPQLEALAAGTDLVTLSLGGNEFGLFGSIIGGCSGLAPWTATGSPCRDNFVTAGGDSKERDARRIRAEIAEAVADIRDAAPDADVLVVGYPQLMPTDGSCAAAGLTSEDVAWASRIQDVLNGSLRRAAESNDAGYVDLAVASRGHDVCAGPDAWVNGRRDRAERALSFHPFQKGMVGVARVVYEALRGADAPVVTGDAAPPEGSVIRSR